MRQHQRREVNMKKRFYKLYHTACGNVNQAQQAEEVRLSQAQAVFWRNHEL